MKSSNHLHIARLMSECPPPACPEHLWKGVSHTTLETLNPAEQGDAFSAPGWKQVPRACTVSRTLAGGRGCVHAHMLLPARGSAAWPAFPWAGHRATAEEREAPAPSCPDTRTHLSRSQSQHTVFKMRAPRKGLFGK